MEITSLPVKVLSAFDRGIGVLYGVRFVAEDAATLTAVLRGLSVGAKLVAPDPDDSDAGLEVRRSTNGWEIKHGRHGCDGAWKAAEISEAVRRLLPGIATEEARHVGCSLWVPRAEP